MLTLSKTFALGAKRIEVDQSLLLMDRTISALRTSVVDDVHLCLRIADLLEALTSRIRQKFIPFTAQSASSPQQHIHDQHRYSARPATSTAQRSAPENVQYVRQPRDESRPQNLSSSTFAGIPDTNITVMPPPRGFYNTAAYTTNNYARPPQFPPQYPQQVAQSQLQPQPNQYPTNAQTLTSNFGFPSEEDWLTLDLQPLLEGNGLPSGVDDNWFGNAFGPETHNNLEVLGKLVDEGWPQQPQQPQQ